MINNTYDVFDDDENPQSNIENYHFIEKENKITEQEGELDMSIFEFNRNYNNETDNESEIVQRTFFRTNQKTIQRKQIFNIEKSKKKGRKKFGANISSKIKHDKNSSDNIRQKIKRRFIQRIKDYLNFLYNKYFNLKNRQSDNFLKKIKPKNLENFSMTLRELFSSDLGSKYTKMDKKYNKKNIDILIQKNEAKEIIKLLNKTLKEVYEIYINKEIPEFSLVHDLNIIKKKEGNYYKNRYEKIAQKLIAFQKKGKNDSLNIEEVNETSNS
jgi:hypothetical protein